MLKQASRFQADELKSILQRALNGNDCLSFTLRKFFAFTYVLATRGETEQKALQISDFMLKDLNGEEVLVFDPSMSFKNYQGGLNQRGPMVR